MSKLKTAWRKLWRLTVGPVVVVIGLILIPLPGPGWLIVFVGLAIMAPEFEPAERLLNWARARFDQAADKAKARIEARKQKNDRSG